MRLFKTMLFAGLTMFLLCAWLFQSANNPASAYTQILSPTPARTPTPNTDSDPERRTTITIDYTLYDWWLIRYSNNNIVCGLSVDHTGWPTGDDILAFCDQKIYNEWKLTRPCDIAKISSYSQCPGFYLQELGSRPAQRKLEVELPPPVAWITIANCNASPPDTRCTSLPSILLKAEEPLPNENIISVQGVIGGDAFTCMGETCMVPLKPTGLDGINVEFWAESSFGDSTPHYTARVRLVPWGDFMNPERTSNDPLLYYVDVLSSQWRDSKLATCSETWQVFPSIGGPPDWLKSPQDPLELQSDISYYYLAGSMITYGIADASGCLDGGLQAPNIASPCGVEAARPQLIEWQNRFDKEIIQASVDTGVPSRLLKNVFSRESQIWPGIYKTYKEAGLGQMTSNGADTILLWNQEFYQQFCPLVLNKKYCETPFALLGAPEQEMLRGALVHKVDASCPDCPAGIDLKEANYSVNVFAKTLLANCDQVGALISYHTNLSPGQAATYDDLWRFTLVNYNAGSGCLSRAIRSAWTANQRLDWATVTQYLDPVCSSAIGYVEDITRMLKPTPTPTAWLPYDNKFPTPILPRVVSTFTPTPTVLRSATPPATATGTPFTRTPTPTITGTLPTHTPTITGTLPTTTPTPTSTVTPTVTNTPTP